MSQSSLLINLIGWNPVHHLHSVRLMTSFAVPGFFWEIKCFCFIPFPWRSQSSHGILFITRKPLEATGQGEEVFNFKKLSLLVKTPTPSCGPERLPHYETDSIGVLGFWGQYQKYLIFKIPQWPMMLSVLCGISYRTGFQPYCPALPPS